MSEQLDLEHLREVAQKAQKATGAWRLRRHTDARGWGPGDVGLYGKHGYIVRPGNDGGMFNDHDAAEHIVAFDPPTMLALLDLFTRPSQDAAGDAGRET